VKASLKTKKQSLNNAGYEHLIQMTGWGLTLKPKLVKLIFKNSASTSKKYNKVSITKINWLTLFREIIVVNSENHTKPINTPGGQNAELLIVKASDSYSYHWVLKG
jgi:hypothetical protein